MKKHILCFGDSNTHGYCADPGDCADGGTRFNENERWTCLLGQQLGPEYLVIEEGLGGRTTVFQDPLTEGMCGLDVLFPVMMSHEPLDLMIIMLGTLLLAAIHLLGGYVCIRFWVPVLVVPGLVSILSAHILEPVLQKYEEPQAA